MIVVVHIDIYRVQRPVYHTKHLLPSDKLIVLALLGELFI